DVSIHGNLLFMSVEQTRGRIDCGAQAVSTPVSAERFRGVRIFDISDIRNPKQVAAIQTCRGSHTHTLVVDPKDNANIYVYGSGTSSVRSAEELAGCSGLKPEEDPNTALFSIDVIQVRLDAVSDKNFAYWHSATFNNDGTKVIFTDEWGGGTRPRCRSIDPPNWGADAIFDIVDRKLRFGNYYKMPAPQTEQENCVAHN